MSRAGLDRVPAEVAAMFDRVAERYDRTNDVLSVGLDRRWRRAVARAVAPQPGQRLLDVAAGTGTSTAALGRAGALVIGCDFSLGMLRVGRAQRPELRLVAGDALRLPFADRSFDAVTMSFGLRNTADPVAALRELRRVTRPGGRLVICEFSRPLWPLARAGYGRYLLPALPLVARALSASPAAYGYLADSIRAWPDQRGMAARLAEAGWRAITWRSLTGGIVALHTAAAPALDFRVTS